MFITEANSSQLKSEQINTKISKSIHTYIHTYSDIKNNDNILMKRQKSNKGKMPPCQQFS